MQGRFTLPIKRLVLNLTSVKADKRPAPGAELLDKREGARD